MQSDALAATPSLAPGDRAQVDPHHQAALDALSTEILRLARSCRSALPSAEDRARRWQQATVLCAAYQSWEQLGHVAEVARVSPEALIERLEAQAEESQTEEEDEVED